MFGSKSYLTFNTFSQLFKHKTTYTSIHGTTHAPPHPPIPLAPSSAHPAQVPKRARPLLSLPSGGTWNSWSSCASVEAELQIARTPVGGPHDDASTRSLPTSCSTPSCAGSATFLRLAHDTTSSRCLPPQPLAAEPTVHHEWKVVPPSS
jgi:hypothetical protein